MCVCVYSLTLTSHTDAVDVGSKDNPMHVIMQPKKGVSGWVCVHVRRCVWVCVDVL